MAEIMVTLLGKAPLVVHNGRMADPLNDHAKRLKKLTGKTKRTDSDNALISRTEFEGALYYDEEHGPFIPGENVHKCFVEAGRLRKLGKELERSLIVVREILPIQYEGPREISELYEQGFLYRKSVTVDRGKRAMRTRPRFDEWSISAPFVLDTNRLDVDMFEPIVLDAGEYIGLGERRPTFGRFIATVTTR